MGEPTVMELLAISVIAIITCFGGMILLMKTTEWANRYAGHDE